MSREGLELIITAAVVVAGFAVILAVARRLWVKLKPELFADLVTSGVDAAAQIVSPDKLAASMLLQAREWLARSTSQEAEMALSGVDGIERNPSAVEALAGLIAAALARLEATTLLLKSNGQATYLIVLPNGYDGGRGARRHLALGDDWPRQLAGLRDATFGQDNVGTVTALLFFVDPDRDASSLVVSLAAGTRTIVPRAMVGVSGERSDLECAELNMEFRRAT